MARSSSRCKEGESPGGGVLKNFYAMPFTFRLNSATPLTKSNLNELGDRKSGEPEDVPPTD
jgi:hypothetical protein